MSNALGAAFVCPLARTIYHKLSIAAYQPVLAVVPLDHCAVEPGLRVHADNTPLSQGRGDSVHAQASSATHGRSSSASAHSPSRIEPVAVGNAEHSTFDLLPVNLPSSATSTSGAAPRAQHSGARGYHNHSASPHDSRPTSSYTRHPIWPSRAPRESACRATIGVARCCAFLHQASASSGLAHESRPRARSRAQVLHDATFAVFGVRPPRRSELGRSDERVRSRERLIVNSSFFPLPAWQPPSCHAKRLAQRPLPIHRALAVPFRARSPTLQPISARKPKDPAPCCPQPASR